MKITSNDIGCEITAEPGERLTDCDTDQVRELLRNNGWVFFSGFEPTVEDFETFTNRFGTCANTRTVHYPEGGEALGFHAEDAYNPYRPDTIWFLCRYEGSDGGAPTGVVDGVRLLAEMPEEWRQFCREHTIRFDRTWSAELWQNAVGADARDEMEALLSKIPDLTYEFLPDGSLYVGQEVPLVVTTPAGEESFSNTLSQASTEPPFYGMTLGDGSPVPQELVDLVDTMAIERELQIGWKSGQVAVIDNYRMMHRRGEYSGKDRDLRARHCEDFFGSVLPDDSTPVTAWTKSLLQGDEGYPTRVGRPAEVGQR
jgi:Taurine catabolism dioxygenase TauD, TfdA family